MKRLGCVALSMLLMISLWIFPVSAEEPEFAGKSWCLVDTATGTLLRAFNEHEPLAPASVTKVMTMLLIMEAIDSGALNWTDSVTASEAAAAKGGSQVYLKVGETMTVEEMVKSIAVSSANDCACAMAEKIAGSEAAFVEKMNARAKELGMNDTHFVNCTGLDDGPNASGHRTSAYDIALMSRELLSQHPDIRKYTTIWMDTVRDGAFGLSNTNKLVRFYDGCTGLKTGFTSGAGYCLSASAQRDGLELIAVVMGAKTSPERFDTCRGLLDWGFASFALYTPELPEFTPIPVKLGKSDSVTPVPQTNPQLLVEKGRLSGLTTEFTLEPELSAPVEQGQTVGRLTVLQDGNILTEIPLVAKESVARMNFSDLFRLLLGKLAMSP